MYLLFSKCALEIYECFLRAFKDWIPSERVKPVFALLWSTECDHERLLDYSEHEDTWNEQMKNVLRSYKVTITNNEVCYIEITSKMLWVQWIVNSKSPFGQKYRVRTGFSAWGSTSCVSCSPFPFRILGTSLWIVCPKFSRPNISLTRTIE